MNVSAIGAGTLGTAIHLSGSLGLEVLRAAGEAGARILAIHHPRIAERALLLIPLRKLNPNPVLPDGTRLKDVRVDTNGVFPSASPLAVRP